MREASISLAIILFISIFGCIISTGEPISTDDVSENVTNSEDRGDNVQDVLGCTDSNADNYDYNATKDDGSCRYDMSPLLLIAVGCSTCVSIWAVMFVINLLIELWDDRGARKKGYRNWNHQMEVEGQREKQEEARKEREKQLEERQRKEAILKRNRAKLPILREELEPYAKLLLPSLTEFKIDPVDEILSISYPVGKRTRKLYYHQVFTRNSESIKQAIAKDYGQESQYIREMERKEAERKISGRSCQAATGSWGTGSCLNYAKRICPRCQNFVCNAHTSNSYYGAKEMCTTCARVLSDV